MDDAVNVLDLGYATIFEIYNSFFTGDLISNVTYGFKILAVILFLLSVFSSMVQKMGSQYGFNGEIALPYNLNKFVTSLIFVLLIAGYDKLLLFMDSLLLPLDGTFSDYTPLQFGVDESDLDTIGETKPWYSSLGEIAEIWLSMANGFGDDILFILVYGITKLIDSMIYIVFLVERFFFLGLLKILGPFAILISIFKTGGEMFWKWLKLYTAVYLLIFPFFLIMGFSNEIIEYAATKVDGMGFVAGAFSKGFMAAIFILVIWIKLRLFKKSYELVYKVMS